eukprot:TRINITY_DN7537_c0_g1_i3.p1 TRINITY_DN7537_c0_g1~~TRINITY_DN7537_c0_g1_i3.p1  ORF type:complete len:1239 (-),score=274.19 TRINITY_DN7537_c0_g1_i3:62-3778(-)
MSVYSISVKNGSRTEKIQWKKGSSVAEFQKLIQTYFTTIGGILGFRDPSGRIISLDTIVKRPEDIKPNEVYTLITERNSPDRESGKHSRPSSRVHSVYQVNLSGKSDISPEEKTRQYDNLTYYKDINQAINSSTSCNHKVLFVLRNKDDLSLVNPYLTTFSARRDEVAFGYVYLASVSLEDSSIKFCLKPPLIALFHKEGKILELNLDGSETTFNEVLENIIQKREITSAHRSEQLSTNGKSTLKVSQEMQKYLLEILDQLSAQNKLNDMEYYYLKCMIYEDMQDFWGRVMPLFSSDEPIKNTQKFLCDFLIEKQIRLFERTEPQQPQPERIDLHRFQSRPQTADPSQGKDRLLWSKNLSSSPMVKTTVNKGKELSTIQEKFIQVIAHLESNHLIDEKTSSLIKTLILEENSDVYRALNSFLHEAIDERILCKKIYALAEKNEFYFERPTSPLPRKDELINFMNTVVRQHIKNERDLEILNRLICEGEEKIYSAFQVFESDRDQDDLLDTLLRIINHYKGHKSKSKEKLGGEEKDRRDVQQKQKIQKEEIEEKPHLEETPSSYFLKKVEESFQLRVQKNDPFTAGLNEAVINKASLTRLLESLKSSGELDKFSDEEFGTVFWLLEHREDVLIRSFLKFRDTFDRQGLVENIRDISKNAFWETIDENFLKTDVDFIMTKRLEANTLVCILIQLFRFHNNLTSLLENLRVVIKNYRDLTFTSVSKKKSISNSFKFKVDDEPTKELRLHRESSEAKSELLDVVVVPPLKADPPKSQFYNEKRGGGSSSPSERGDSPTNAEDKSSKRHGKYKNLFVKTNKDPKAFHLKLIDTDKQINLSSEMLPSLPNESDDPGSGASILDKFYDNSSLYSKHRELFNHMMSQANFLTKEDKQHLERLFDMHYRGIFDAIALYEQKGQIDDVKEILRQLLNVDSDCCTVENSPRAKIKMTKFNSFRAHLKMIKDVKKMITSRQFNSFLYLFMKEDVAVLSAYEVYLLNSDLEEFLDTLFLIEKISFLKADAILEEIREEFDEIVEKQLKILYSLRSYLNLSTRVTLEKIIRAGDMTVLKIYQDFKKNKLNRNELVNSLVQLGKEKYYELKEVERVLKENKNKQESINLRRKELLQAMTLSKALKGISHLDIVNDAIDAGNCEINCIYEVLEATRDKMDFVENITLLYQKLYKERFAKVVYKLFADFESKEKLDKLIEMVKEHGSVQSIFEVYLLTQDEADLASSLNIVLGSL